MIKNVRWFQITSLQDENIWFSAETPKLLKM